MSYFSLLIMVFFSFTFLKADTFQSLNFTLTKEMQAAQDKAKLCEKPSLAKDQFAYDFHYGCFCGKEYPAIKHTSSQNYRDLDKREKEELIVQYYKVKPYDSIDEICMKHDICYISQGGADKVCNDAIYSSLQELQDTFSSLNYKTKDKKEERCNALASDISSIFQTVFVAEDDRTLVDWGVGIMTTSMIVGSKTMQKTVYALSNSTLYPLEGERCLLEDLNTSTE